MERQRALLAAGQLNTASLARFQEALPFEPVNLSRLERLKAERVEAWFTMQAGVGRHADQRRQAQMAARRALQRVAEGLRARGLAPADRRQEMLASVHAAELQLPESWLAFVVSR